MSATMIRRMIERDKRSQLRQEQLPLECSGRPGAMSAPETPPVPKGPARPEDHGLPSRNRRRPEGRAAPHQAAHCRVPSPERSRPSSCQGRRLAAVHYGERAAADSAHSDVRSHSDQRRAHPPAGPSSASASLPSGERPGHCQSPRSRSIPASPLLRLAPAAAVD
jgi:hypothetical protein